MLAAGYSTKMTQKDQQGVFAFEDFAEGDLFSACGEEGKVGGGRIKFHVSGSRCQVESGKQRVYLEPIPTRYVMFFFAHATR